MLDKTKDYMIIPNSFTERMYIYKRLVDIGVPHYDNTLDDIGQIDDWESFPRICFTSGVSRLDTTRHIPDDTDTIVTMEEFIRLWNGYTNPWRESKIIFDFLSVK